MKEKSLHDALKQEPVFYAAAIAKAGGNEASVERGPSMQRPEALGMAMLLERGGQTGAAAIMREQHAEIERLRAERDADRRREYGYSQETVDALTKERDALRADAERYQWLRARDHWPASFDLVRGPELDAAIDAAREAKFLSMLRDAAQQALEALESCDSQHLSDGGRQWYDDKLVEPAIAALRAALAEPVQEPVAWLRVIDEAMVTHHLGVADPADDYDTAKRKMNSLLCCAQDIGAYFASVPQRPAPEPVSNTTTLRAMLECCLSWEPNACVLGNVTARQAVIALCAALAEPVQDEHDALRVDAERYRWLRDDWLRFLVSGPICVLADKWGTPVQQHHDGDPEIGPARHVTLDGKQLDAAIDAAIDAAREAK